MSRAGYPPRSAFEGPSAGSAAGGGIEDPAMTAVSPRFTSQVEMDTRRESFNSRDRRSVVVCPELPGYLHEQWLSFISIPVKSALRNCPERLTYLRVSAMTWSTFPNPYSNARPREIFVDGYWRVVSG